MIKVLPCVMCFIDGVSKDRSVSSSFNYALSNADIHID